MDNVMEEEKWLSHGGGTVMGDCVSSCCSLTELFVVRDGYIIRYSGVYLERGRYSVEHILREHGDSPRVFADEQGNYIFFGFIGGGVLFSLVTEEYYAVEYLGVFVTAYLERKKLIILFESSFIVSSIYDVIHKNKRDKVYVLRNSEKIGEKKKIVVSKSTGRVLVSGERLFEIESPDIFQDRSNSIVQIEDKLSRRVSLRVTSPVLMRPEPLTFITEEVEEEIFTEWGLIVIYRTGIEAYKKESANYRLSYVYKGEFTSLKRKDTVYEEKKAFVRNKTQIVEITESAPLLFHETKESSYLLNEHILLESKKILLILRKEIDYEQEITSTPKKEKSINRSLIDSTDILISNIKKYKAIDYSLIEKREEEEQILLLKKLLNSFEKEISNNLQILFLSLKEKLIYLFNVKKEIEAIKGNSEKLFTETKTNNLRVTERIEAVKNSFKSLKTHFSEKQEESPELVSLKASISSAKEKIKEFSISAQSNELLQNELLLLKNQNAFIKKKLKEYPAQ
ncbi:hypothetical protein NEFER03_0429 [Nematocida sp. LUAm3]|nr:hypothetical protein NEFER03_0429 [Nematocida sp. LUAm3]KAI5175887.1 hypothetical protein NEFER02_1747 [Nematocida sp. LUAm2]KAI5178731.1 hypothetical protein NEFER01_1850 [Nematocida sp. LUAm1]